VASAWLAKLLSDPTALFTAVTGVGTIVLAVSTILLWLMTRKAASAAKASADALTAIERAYVFVEVAFAGFVSDDGSGDEIHAHVKIWNYGKTPSVVSMIRAYMVVQPSAPQSLIDLPGADRELPPGLGIATNCAFPIEVSKKLAPREQADIETLAIAVYCVGVIQYADVLGNSHQTGYCWQYVPRSVGFQICREAMRLNFRT
jgi:hypothetical protein